MEESVSETSICWNIYIVRSFSPRLKLACAFSVLLVPPNKFLCHVQTTRVLYARSWRWKKHAEREQRNFESPTGFVGNDDDNYHGGLASREGESKRGLNDKWYIPIVLTGRELRAKFNFWNREFPEELSRSRSRTSDKINNRTSTYEKSTPLFAERWFWLFISSCLWLIWHCRLF